MYNDYLIEFTGSLVVSGIDREDAIEYANELIGHGEFEIKSLHIAKERKKGRTKDEY